MGIIIAFDGDDGGQRAAMEIAIRESIKMERNTPAPFDIEFDNRLGGFRGISTNDLVCELQHQRQQLSETPLTKAHRKYIVDYVGRIGKELERRRDMSWTGTATSEVIQAIRDKSNLADIIATYTKVFIHQGQWSFLCPLHNDTVPSGTINREKQVWYCHSCCRGGDVFALVMACERIDFGEAVRLLSRNLGIDVS